MELKVRMVDSKASMTAAETFPAYFKVPEVAAMVDVSSDTVYRWISEGRLKAVKFGPKTVRITAQAIEDMATAYHPADRLREMGVNISPTVREVEDNHLKALAGMGVMV